MLSQVFLVLVLAALLPIEVQSVELPSITKKPDRKMFPGRKVLSEINVVNGETWGKWTHEEYCEEGSWAIGFNLKIEPPQGLLGDDTAMNAISLKCADINGTAKGDITSGMGPWGLWSGEKECMNVKGTQFFITGFKLKVQPYRILQDDTAANNIIVQCRRFDTDENLYEMEGYGAEWGTYADFSEPCPLHAAVCGLKTRIHPRQGLIGDDTALNDIMFYCCEDHLEGKPRADRIRQTFLSKNETNSNSGR